jgi:glycosyltransferase involved in cell wall biosynthesis
VARTDIRTVNLGFDTDRYTPDGGPRTNVLTVGIVDEVNVRRKGLETFLASARLLPDLPFVLVGGRPNPATERLRSIAPRNLRILGALTDDALLEEYRRARVYVQISEYEAFGSALGEAMACGCVPVGTRVGGIPTLIGDMGSYVPVHEAEATAEAIRSAHASGDGGAARARIVERFSLDRRRQALFEVIDGLASS